METTKEELAIGFRPAFEIKTQADLELAVPRFLLGVTFSRSTSKNYPMAVRIAEGAEFYSTNEVDGTLFHFILFQKNREDAMRARSLLKYIRGWRGSQVFAGAGGQQSAYTMMDVLDCYIQASASKDHKTHCVVRIPEYMMHPYDRDDGPWYFPCRHVFRFNGQDVEPSNPTASIQDQYHAAGVRRGCDSCPFFRPESLLKMPRSRRGLGLPDYSHDEEEFGDIRQFVRF